MSTSSVRAKVYAFHWIYWNRMLKEAWFEGDILEQINQLLQGK